MLRDDISCLHDKQVRDKSCLSLAAETPCSYCLHYKLFFFCYLSKQSTFLTFPIVLLFFFFSADCQPKIFSLLFPP